MKEGKYDYKIAQLEAMLLAEEKAESEARGYGANLSHWYGNSKPINLDAEALRELIRHYKRRNLHDNID